MPSILPLPLNVLPFTPRQRPDPDPNPPSSAPPGTRAKVDIMALRASRRLPLFHPADNPGAELTEEEIEELAGKTLQETARMGAYRGVTRCKRRWRVRLWQPARKKYLDVGYYPTREEAIRALSEARQREARAA